MTALADIHFEHVETNGIRLHVAQAGPADGPLVILLHGFPEFWYEWRKQIPALVQAGYCVWAPDQRGYNLSDKPAGVANYRLDKLADDILGLMDAAGRERASVIGHDWGGVVAWWLAANDPERLERLAILNVPHPLVMRRLLRSSLRQLARSWYMFAIQLPWLPEWGARRNNWQALSQGLRDSSRPSTFSDADFEQYRAAWSQPGAYTAMLNWYRAMFRLRLLPPKHKRNTVPTLVLWGAQDKFIGREAASMSIELCDNGQLEFFEQATHWLPHEKADEVNMRLLAFLANTDFGKQV